MNKKFVLATFGEKFGTDTSPNVAKVTETLDKTVNQSIYLIPILNYFSNL